MLRLGIPSAATGAVARASWASLLAAGPPLCRRAPAGPRGGLEASPGLPHPSVYDEETTRRRQMSSHAAGRFSYYGN